MTPGVYVHIPFCISKCRYCSFSSVAYKNGPAVRYIDALIREIRSSDDGVRPGSVYIGGGTPTVLGTDELLRLISAIRGKFGTDEEAEFTVEANPGTLGGIDLVALRSSGVNRVSVGAQSFDRSELEMLGRGHTPADVHESVGLLRRAGFNNVGLDLIYGLPGQDMARWKKTLGFAMALGPEHISAYCLSVEEGTPFYAMQAKGGLDLPSEEAQADMYLLASGMLEDAGYSRYEFSNFALPGRECRHNTGYWSGADWLGFGAAAHSSIGGTRTENIGSVEGYIDAVNTGKPPVAATERPSAAELETEYLMLGLRRAAGISLRDYSARFGRELSHGRMESISRLYGAGYVEIDSERLRLTEKGVLASNPVIAQLLL